MYSQNQFDEWRNILDEFSDYEIYHEHSYIHIIDNFTSFENQKDEGYFIRLINNHSIAYFTSSGPMTMNALVSMKREIFFNQLNKEMSFSKNVNYINNDIQANDNREFLEFLKRNFKKAEYDFKLVEYQNQMTLLTKTSTVINNANFLKISIYDYLSRITYVQYLKYPSIKDFNLRMYSNFGKSKPRISNYKYVELSESCNSTFLGYLSYYLAYGHLPVEKLSKHFNLIDSGNFPVINDYNIYDQEGIKRKDTILFDEGYIKDKLCLLGKPNISTGSANRIHYDKLPNLKIHFLKLLNKSKGQYSFDNNDTIKILKIVEEECDYNIFTGDFRGRAIIDCKNTLYFTGIECNIFKCYLNIISSTDKDAIIFPNCAFKVLIPSDCIKIL